MIIALTHMRVYQDKKLSQEVSDIDIDLGGHDHIIMR
jgi:2',3'-cyclic-nucleotide 2'-phosphodiesterase (5'-nucleotidase family)